MNYSRLEQLLSAQSWQEAGKETASILLKTCGKEVNDKLTLEDIENFPCEVLHAIDKLWVQHSKGSSGLSTQSSIWQETNRNYTAFCKEVGWELSNQRQNLRGHHPQLFNFPSSAFVLEPGIHGPKFLSRLETCEL